MQDIIAYIIVFFAVAFAAYRGYRFFSRAGDENSCGCSTSACSSCSEAHKCDPDNSVR